jgi:hypothetical protein
VMPAAEHSAAGIFVMASIVSLSAHNHRHEGSRRRLEP